MNKLRFILPAAVLVLSALACRTGFGKQPTPTPLPTVAPLRTATAVPTKIPPTPPPTAVVQVTQPNISLRTIQESSENPKYNIDIEYPYLENTPPGVGFNMIVDELLQGQIEGFKIDAANSEEFRQQNMPEAFSSLEARYQVTNDANGVLSVLFDMYSYVVGYAHPFPLTRTVNYDLRQDVPLELEDLFKPGSNYLQVISDYTTDSLEKSGTLDFREGAAPSVQNYRNWNITAHDLKITFEPAQVAAYAAGTQTVHIPYSVLADIIDPAGPLAKFPIGK